MAYLLIHIVIIYCSQLLTIESELIFLDFYEPNYHLIFLLILTWEYHTNISERCINLIDLNRANKTGVVRSLQQTAFHICQASYLYYHWSLLDLQFFYPEFEWDGEAVIYLNVINMFNACSIWALSILWHLLLLLC